MRLPWGGGEELAKTSSFLLNDVDPLHRSLGCTVALMNVIRERFQAYRPRLERALFGLALLGGLDVVHLYIQKRRHFEDGCVGVSSLDAMESTFNCAAVTAGPGSELFGVSNLTWGLGFFLLTAALTVVVFWARSGLREWVHGGRAVLLTGGVLYSGYLTYLQFGPIDTLCLLCLGSALITTLLFAAQVAILVASSSPIDTPMPNRLMKRQIALFVYFAATALVVAGADFVYFDAGQDASTRQTVSATAGADEPAACELDSSKSPLEDNGASLVNFQDITKGSSDADVTVIEYFDPNCPHCKDFHEQVMKKLVEARSDDVRFVFKPFPLGRSSIPEIQALYVADQSGKFTEMLEAQYARQGRSGISTSDLRAIASEIDMDPDVLTNRIEEGEYRNQVLQLRKRAVKIGVESTPTVLVEGHFLKNRSLECMNTFIDQAKAGSLGSSASE